MVQDTRADVECPIGSSNPPHAITLHSPQIVYGNHRRDVQCGYL